MTKTIIAIAAAAVLTGCATAENFVQTSGDRCLLAGFQPGTEQYSACVRVTSSDMAKAHNENVAAGFAAGVAGGAAYHAYTRPRSSVVYHR